MMDKLIDEAREDVNHYKLTRHNDRVDRRAREGFILTRHANESLAFSRIDDKTSLSDRQQVSLIQQGRQEREVRQRRDMNEFLDQLDQEIDDATPVGTKNKYRPIQDDFEVVSFTMNHNELTFVIGFLPCHTCL